MINRTNVSRDNGINVFVGYCMAVACLDTIIDKKRDWPLDQRYDSPIIDIAKEKCRGISDRIAEYLPQFARKYTSCLKRKITQSRLNISLLDNSGNSDLAGVGN